MRRILPLLGSVCLLGSVTPADAQSLGRQETKENLDLPVEVESSVDALEEAPEVIRLFGQQLEGDTFVFAISGSGIMSFGRALDRAKREVTRAISELSGGAHYAIVFIGKEPKKFPASGRPAKVLPDTEARVRGFFEGIHCGAGSCTLQGLAAALQFANRSPSERVTVAYLGEGGAECRGADEQEYLDKTLKTVAALNYREARINTVGVARFTRVQCEFLSKLASSNGGVFVVTELAMGD